MLCVLGLATVLGIFFWFAESAPLSRPEGPGFNYGFGPEWECKSFGNAGPVCIKKVK